MPEEEEEEANTGVNDASSWVTPFSKIFAVASRTQTLKITSQSARHGF